jgi:chemotaxis protein methyltransferase CheR
LVSLSPSEQNDGFLALKSVIGARLGIALEKYPTVAIRMLMAAMPGAKAGWQPDQGALERMVTACSVGETMFLRHPEQFTALEGVLPELRAEASGRSLRIWSAGCASGEEAYSLAATASQVLGTSVEVVGTDMSAEAIQRARNGRYRLWSLRGVDDAAVKNWLVVRDLEVSIKVQLKPLVSFRQQNLMESGYPEALDVIFCRNVLLYFREESAQRVYERFAEVSRPNAHLFIGYCDPEPVRGGAWEEVWVDNVRFFRRRRAGELLSKEPPRPARRTTSHRSPSGGPPQPEFTRPEDRPPLTACLDAARGFCSQGAHGEALGLLKSLGNTFALAPELHVLTALVADEIGKLDDAVEAARRAFFLAPEAAITHFLLGSCLCRRGHRDVGTERLRGALGILAKADDPLAALPYGEGFTALQIRRMIDAQLQGR